MMMMFVGKDIASRRSTCLVMSDNLNEVAFVACVRPSCVLPLLL